MRGVTKNACWNVHNARPPANTVTKISPEKELNIKKDGNNKNNNNSPPPTTTTAYNRKKGGGPPKAGEHENCLNNNIEDYSVIEDENHPDFGINGFLSAERFTNGDRLPLLQNNVQESRMVPPNLELHPGFVALPVDASDGMQRSGSSTTITTLSTTAGGENVGQHRFGVTENDFVDEDEEGGGKGREVGAGGMDNPVYELYNAADYRELVNQPSLRSQSQFTPYFGQQMDTVNLYGGGKENEQQLTEWNNEKLQNNNNTTTGTNTINIGSANGGGRIFYQQNQGNGGGIVENNNINTPNLLPYFLNMQPSNRQQQIDREQNFQKAEQRRKMQKRKQLSKENAQIIKPQEQPGYMGEMEVNEILKVLGLEPDHRAPHKSNSPSATRGTGLDTSNGKKGGNKKQQRQQKQQQRISQQNGKKQRQQQFIGEGGRQESYASPAEDDEEEMDVDIELDNGNIGDDEGAGNNPNAQFPPSAHGKQQRRDREPIAIEMILDGIWEKPIEKEIKQTMEMNGKEQQQKATYDGKWESPVVKKTLQAHEEQNRKLMEEIEKKKKAEEEDKIRKKKEEEERKKKKAALEEEEKMQKKKAAQKEAEEKERKKAESEERKKRQKEERKIKKAREEEEERKRRMQMQQAQEEEEEKKKENERKRLLALKEEEEEKQRKENEANAQEEIIELKKEDGEQGGQIIINDEKPLDEEQMEQQSKTEEEMNKKQGKKKAVWCSSSLAANKQKWKQQQQTIRQTPLLDRIPANVLAQLKSKCGWRNPITIVFDTSRLNNSSTQSGSQTVEPCVICSIENK